MDFSYWYNLGKNFSFDFYFKNKKKFKILRFVLVFIVVFLVIYFTFIHSSALSVSTSDDCFSSSSQVQNLLTLIPKDKIYSNYVVFRSSDTEYFLFYGDLNLDNSIISGKNLNFIKYSRSGSSYSYTYSFGTDDLNLNVNNIITSNLNFIKSSNSFTFDNSKNEFIISQVLLVFLPIFCFLFIWRSLKHEFI